MLTYQNEGQSETLTNQAIPYLMHQFQIGTNNTWQSSNLKLHLFIVKYIIKFEQPNKNDNDKHNHNTKPPLLNRH